MEMRQSCLDIPRTKWNWKKSCLLKYGDLSEQTVGEVFILLSLLAVRYMCFTCVSCMLMCQYFTRVLCILHVCDVFFTAAEYCKKLKSERAQMQNEADILKQEINSLNQAIRY